MMAILTIAAGLISAACVADEPAEGNSVRAGQLLSGSVSVKNKGTTSAAVPDVAATPDRKGEDMPAPTEAKKENAIICMETSEGKIRVEMWPDKSPETVSNFLAYVEAGFFDGLIFHRVIKNFMIQGGGFDANMRQKATRQPIRNEACAQAQNKRGTIAMARTSDINSATAQFFINLVDNGFLDHRDKSAQGFGYCVFGRVIEGMEVVDRIGATKTTRMGMMADVPVQPIQIKSVKIESR